MKIQTVPAAGLIEDREVYPRHDVDDSHVSDLARALRSGATLPPVIACRITKRLADGWHRVRAYKRVYGDAAQVPVEWRNYPDEAALFRDAAALNSIHGRKLDRQDQVRVVIISERLGISRKDVAVLLQVPEERVDELHVRVVVVEGEPEPAKRVAAFKYGEPITPGQAAAMRSFPGVYPLQHVRQLDRIIREGLFDESDSDLMLALHELARLIEAKVPEPEIAAMA